MKSVARWVRAAGAGLALAAGVVAVPQVSLSAVASETAPPGRPCILIYPPPPGCEGPDMPPEQPPPPPVEPPSFPPTPPDAPGEDRVSVSTDSQVYLLGGEVVVTVVNNSPETLAGGMGYQCGLVQLEVLDAESWVPAPGGAEICPAIARLLAPGEVYTETLTAGPGAGVYRVVVRLSGPLGEETGVSEPYTVE